MNKLKFPAMMTFLFTMGLVILVMEITVGGTTSPAVIITAGALIGLPTFIGAGGIDREKKYLHLEAPSEMKARIAAAMPSLADVEYTACRDRYVATGDMTDLYAMTLAMDPFWTPPRNAIKDSYDKMMALEAKRRNAEEKANFYGTAYPTKGQRHVKKTIQPKTGLTQSTGPR